MELADTNVLPCRSKMGGSEAMHSRGPPTEAESTSPIHCNAQTGDVEFDKVNGVTGTGLS